MTMVWLDMLSAAGGAANSMMPGGPGASQGMMMQTPEGIIVGGDIGTSVAVGSMIPNMQGSAGKEEEDKGDSETKKDGAYRADKYSDSWQKGSLQETVDKFAPDTKPIDTNTGKTIYRNNDTGIEVVYDKNGDYFSINDTNVTGKRSYLDLNGNKVPNNVMTETGTQRGMTQGEYNAITHFKNID